MSAPEPRFQDLGVRISSALGLAALSFVAIAMGGFTLILFVSALVAAIAWELARMLGASQPLIVGLLTFVAVLLASLVPWEMRALFVVAATAISYGLVKNHKALFVISHVMIVLGGVSFLILSSTGGLLWLGWLIGVVVLTDIAGYFAGRMLGGPKFWPSLSPKKTWSGTAAGWAASAVFGAAMMLPLGVGLNLVILSIGISFASQLGDFFQSLVKRRSDVKDSSGLIPGHGGVWDRFDGMLAAAVIYWPLSLVI